MDIILEDEGIQLVKQNGQFFLIFDEGELAVSIRKLMITDEEAKQVVGNPASSYDIIIAYQNKELFET
jgi:hypothetical protein